MLQHKHIVLECDEIHILVKHFVNIGHATGLQSGRRQIFQLLSRNGRNKIQVVDVVKSILEILCNPTQILFGRCAKVNGRRLRDSVAIRMQLAEIKG